MITFYQCMLRDTLNNKTFLSPYLYETKAIAEAEFLKEKKQAQHIHIDEPFHFILIGFVPVTREE